MAPTFDIFGSCDHFDSREISNLDVIGLNRIKHEQLFLILEILITRQLPILSLSHKVKVITLHKMFQILKPRDRIPIATLILRKGVKIIACDDELYSNLIFLNLNFRLKFQKI